MVEPRGWWVERHEGRRSEVPVHGRKGEEEEVGVERAGRWCRRVNEGKGCGDKNYNVVGLGLRHHLRGKCSVERYGPAPFVFSLHRYQC